MARGRKRQSGRGGKLSHIALMSSGKKWDTVATHIHTRCSSVHLERGKINHTLQKDKSPGAVAPSKQEREGDSLGGSNIAEIEKRQTAERKDKKKWRKKKKRKPRSDKNMFKKVSSADSWICGEITTCREEVSAHSSRACRRP